VDSASGLPGRAMGFFSDTYTGLTVATGRMTLPFYENRHWFPKHMTQTEYFKVRSSIAHSE
jgi:hypothetical protein